MSGEHAILFCGGEFSAEAYRRRVELDGGQIIDFASVVSAYQFLQANALSNLEQWLSPVFGIKKGAGGEVSKLYDLSSNNRDASQGTGGSQPIYTANQQNGLPGIVFDNTDDILNATTFAAASNYTLVGVCKEAAVGAYRLWYGNGNLGSNGFALGSDTSTRRCVLHGAVAWNYADTVTTNTELMIGGRDTAVWMRVNGSVKSPTTSTYNAPSGGYLSYGAAPIAGYYKSRTMFDAMAFSVSIGATKAAAIEGFLNAKYAIY